MSVSVPTWLGFMSTQFAEGLPLPRQVGAVLLQARVPPVTGSAGSKDEFASTNFYYTEYIELRKGKNHGDEATEIFISFIAGYDFYCCAFGLRSVYRCLEHAHNGGSVTKTIFLSRRCLERTR